MTLKQKLAQVKHKAVVSKTILTAIWTNKPYTVATEIPETQLAVFTNVTLSDTSRMLGIALASLTKQASITSQSIELITQALKEFNNAYTSELSSKLKETKELNDE